MNDKDKEEFADFVCKHDQGILQAGDESELDMAERVWQAACEYKDREQYIEGSIHESGSIKREMTWKESSDMFERMYMNTISRLDKEYERIREFQAENKKLLEDLESETQKRKILQDAMEFIAGGYYTEWTAEETLEKLKEMENK
jgi:hypothetical protein